MVDGMISVRDLRYAYPGMPADVITGMSFGVADGEVFGFLGPSGAGKTTTQHIVMGLLDGWTGTVEIGGRALRSWRSELYDRIGASFELPVGHPRLTVREDLEYFASLHRSSPRDIPSLLRWVGLSDSLDRPLADLSKGMRGRVNLARSLVHDPELLFLDEPTAGLDPVNARLVRRLIREENARGTTVFLTTHDMVTASEVCHRVAFVVGGRILACDTPRALELAHGRRRIRVTHRVDDHTVSSRFELGTVTPELLGLLGSDRVETIHTEEATLEEVFVAVTGARL